MIKVKMIKKEVKEEIDQDTAYGGGSARGWFKEKEKKKEIPATQSGGMDYAKWCEAHPGEC